MLFHFVALVEHSLRGSRVVDITVCLMDDRLRGWAAKYQSGGGGARVIDSLSMLAQSTNGFTDPARDPPPETAHVTPTAHVDQTEQLKGALANLYEKYRKLKHDMKEQQPQRGRAAATSDPLMSDGGSASLRLDLQLAARRAQDAEERAAALRRELEEERRAGEAGQRALLEARMRVRGVCDEHDDHRPPTQVACVLAGRGVGSAPRCRPR